MVEKPWFWHFDLVEQDRNQGIVWSNMYRHAKPNPGHPCFYQQPPPSIPEYIKAFQRTGHPENNGGKTAGVTNLGLDFV